MSFQTGTQDELLYAFGGASTNLATFTTEDNLLKTYPACGPPQVNFTANLANTGARSSSFKVRACGQVGAAAATTPTFTFSLRLCTSSAFSTAGLLLAASPAMTTVSGVTLGVWQLDVDIVLRTLAASASATTTVVTMGTISGSGFTSLATMPAAGTAPTLATVNVDSAYWLFLSCACGTSSASNLVNTQLFKLYGEN